MKVVFIMYILGFYALECGAPSPSYKAILTALNNHSSTLNNQPDIFYAITVMNNIYYCIIDDTLR